MNSSSTHNRMTFPFLEIINITMAIVIVFQNGPSPRRTPKEERRCETALTLQAGSRLGAAYSVPRSRQREGPGSGRLGRSDRLPLVSLGHRARGPVCAGDALPSFSPEPLPVILCASSSAVDGALQLPGVWEDVLMLDDDGFDQLIHVGLAGHLVVALRH